MEQNLTDLDFQIDALMMLDQLKMEYSKKFMNEKLL